MLNKLGIEEKNLKEVEYKIINFKIGLLDQYFTFGEETIFSLNYLEKLHSFLFQDFHEEEYLSIRKDLTYIDYQNIDRILNLFKEIALKRPKNYRGKIAVLTEILWNYQIFYDGNTRTILAFLKVYSIIFDLDLNYDFKMEIKEDYFINQITKRIKEK